MDIKKTLIGLGGLLLVAGCDHTRWNIFRPNDPPPSNKAQTADQLVNYLNDNAGRVQSFRCDNVGITAYQGIQSVGLTGGKICLDKPRNLRLVADMSGSRAFDMGSNEQEFWFWVRPMSKDDPNYQFYCAHKDIKQAKTMPLPFQPDWVMEAIGMGSYGPASNYQVESDSDTVKLIERTQTPQGKAVRKVIVFRRKPVPAPNPQMQACLLIDDKTGKEICSAKILETQLVGKDNGIVPRRLELHWPENKLKMVMVLNGLTANQSLPPQVFQRPTGTPAFDMARNRLDAQPTQRLHGSQ